LAPIPPTIGSEMIYARAGRCHDGDIHRSSTSDFFEFTSSLCEVCAFTRISPCYLHCHRHHCAPVGERDSSYPRSGTLHESRHADLPKARTGADLNGKIGGGGRGVGSLGAGETFPRAMTGPRGSPCRQCQPTDLPPQQMPDARLRRRPVVLLKSIYLAWCRTSTIGGGEPTQMMWRQKDKSNNRPTTVKEPTNKSVVS
jgi:hypothetical protein